MVGHTGPSSVIGSDAGLAALSARRRVQEGESPGSVPLAGVRGIQFADDVPEPGDGGSPVYLKKRTESRAGLGYGRPRSAPWDGLLRKETFQVRSRASSIA